MNERVIQFRVGVVVVAATIITGILVMLFGEGRQLVKRQYTIFLMFPEAPGVTVDTPIRKHGVLIGRVSKVEIMDEVGGPSGVQLTAKIDDSRRLRKNEVCVIKTESLLGDAVLDFVQQGDPTPEFIQDGDLLANGLVAGNPLEILVNLEGNMKTAIGSIESAANEVGTLARGLNEALGTNDQQLGRILNKTEAALDGVQGAMGTVNDLVGDPELKGALKQSLRELPAFFDDLRATMTDARTTLAGFQRVSQRAETNLQNIENFTRPLGERGEQFVANLSLIVGNVEELTQQLAVFSKSLNDGEGTVSRLINDTELYDQVSDTVSDFSATIRRVRPILDNIRTFTDKIAQDPRLLGVRGALDQRPLGTGLR